MVDDKLTTIQVYSDILNGYSASELDGRFVFIKHYGPVDEYEIERIKYKYYEQAISRNIPTEKQRIEDLKKQKFWDEDREIKIKFTKAEIDNALSGRRGLVLPSQIAHRDKEIEETRQSLLKLELERELIIGLTAEKYSESKTSDYYVFYSLFKDVEFKIPVYTIEEYDELDKDDVQNLINNFNKSVNIINIDNIKKTALSNLFQSSYALASSASDFLGKPVCKFTYYQNMLLSYGSYYKTILSEIGDKITEEHKNNPEKLEAVYISSKNIQKDKEKNPNRQNVEYFGATEEDEKILNRDRSKEDIEMELLMKNGTVTMEDMIKHGLI